MSVFAVKCEKNGLAFKLIHENLLKLGDQKYTILANATYSNIWTDILKELICPRGGTAD